MLNKKTKILKSEKGISLIITLFVMIIVLSVVLSISALLYSEVKIIRNIGGSVIAFYAADSGIEKVLYYDRQNIAPGKPRGICDVCTNCPSNSGTSAINCTPCNYTVVTNQADCDSCKNCKISFETKMTDDPKKSYKTSIDVSTLTTGACPVSMVKVESYGTYTNTKRAIYIDAVGEVKTGLGPDVDGNGTIFDVKNNGDVQIKIEAITPPGLASVTAYIYKDNVFLQSVPLVGGGGSGIWSKTVNVGPGTYYVAIGAIDANGLCTSIIVTQPI